MGFIWLHSHDLYSGDLPWKDSQAAISKGGWGGVERQAYFHFSTCFENFFFIIINMKGETGSHFCFNLQRLRYAICVAIIIYLYFH